jgi:hypothetical protein
MLKIFWFISLLMVLSGCALTAATVGVVAYEINESHKSSIYIQTQISKEIPTGIFMVLLKDENAVIAGSVSAKEDIDKAKEILHSIVSDCTIYSYIAVNSKLDLQYDIAIDNSIKANTIQATDGTVGVINREIYVLTDTPYNDAELMKIQHVKSVIITQTQK